MPIVAAAGLASSIPTHTHPKKQLNQVAKEVEKHAGLVGRFVSALRHEVKKDMEKFGPGSGSTGRK